VRRDIERRLEALERARRPEEPWPPKEGSLAYAIWNSAEDEPLPEERPKGSVLLYFLDILGKRVWDGWQT